MTGKLIKIEERRKESTEEVKIEKEKWWIKNSVPEWVE